MLLLYLLFVTAVALAAITFDRLASERLEGDVRASDLSLARAVAVKTDAELARALTTVEELASFPAVIAADSEQMESLFQAVAVARPEVNLIYRLGADGIMLFHYPLGPGSTLGVDFSFRDYFAQARQTLLPVVSKGRISPTTEQAVATTVMPIVIDGEFSGLVATNIRLQSLSQVLNEIAGEYRPEDDFRISIIDSSGQIIADPDPDRLLVPLIDEQPVVVNRVLEQQSDSVTTTDKSGEAWLMTFAPIPSAGWGVVVRRPASVAFSTVRAFHVGVTAALGLFLVLGLIFWLTLARRVIRPLERVSRFSQMIGEQRGENAQLRADVDLLAARSDQMGYLALSITQMERSIQRRLRELEMLLETSRAVVSSLDLKTVLDRILNQTERLLQAHVCAVVVHDEASGRFHVQASRGLSSEYVRRLQIDPSAPNSPTMRAIRTGSPIHIADTETDPSFSVFRPRSRAEGYRSLLAIPLITQHASAAALLVYFDQPRALTTREIDLARNFANHAAMAIENATLFARSDEQLQEQSRRLEALVESMADGLILEDLTGRVLYCNRRVTSLAGLQPGELDDLSARQVRERLYAKCDGEPSMGDRLEQALFSPANPAFELNLVQQGKSLALRLQSFAVTDPVGTLIGRGQLFQDISDYHELDRMKNSLIATVSHELRTPLAAIKGYATTLLAEDVRWSAEAQREFLQVISQESDRLSNLVTNLLDLSRIEAGSLQIDREACDLAELIDGVRQALDPELRQRVSVEITADMPPVALDRHRVEAVIRNLVHNADRYGDDAGPIRIAAGRQNGEAVVSVEDDGPGIPPDVGDRIFEPFFRIEDGLARSVPGAGLGLSISRGFIEAHGGRIWLEPEAPPTRIAFSLPLEVLE